MAKLKLPIAKEKEFKSRDSILTVLLQNQAVRSVYHITILALVTLIINATVSSYLLEKDFRQTLGLKLIAKGARNWHLALTEWIISYTLCIVGFFCCKIWATKKILRNQNGLKLWDISWSVALIICYLFIFVYSSYFIVTFNLGGASALFVTAENVRLLMKFHSFARNIASKVSNYKDPSKKKFVFPSLANFVLYTFAPTLLYREEYPRTKMIRWSFVFSRIMELFVEIWLISFTLEKYVTPPFQNFCLKKYKLNAIIVYNFENALISALLFQTIFLFILHSWQNLFAELTRFADRRFYDDWWTNTDFSEYFRTWNVIVYEWLHLYVYHEVVKIAPQSIAKLVVLIISAAAHEWIYYYTLGMLFPLTFFQFVVLGYIMLHVRFPKKHLFSFLYQVLLGQGIQMTMYTIEFYARLNAPIENSSFVDYFIPRFLTCGCILW